MGRVLVVTNDFPTRRGGIESFVLALCERMPPDEVVVYTASMPGDKEYDATLPFPVYRDPSSTLLPTPAVARRARRIMRRHACDRVMFGSSAPLGLLASSLRRAGATRIVALTHGHEVWWARVPLTKRALRHIGDSVDVMTYVSDWCRVRISSALSESAAAKMVRLAPGVDTDRFYPGCGGNAVREQLGIGNDVPVVICAARVIRRKGQDRLIRIWPQILDHCPDARLVIVGDGPYLSHCLRLVKRHGLGDSVIFAGSVHWSQMPAFMDAGDVFAMLCRTRLLGLEAEAFGIVSLEAASCALPVLIGRSGGAREAILDGETGFSMESTADESVAGLLQRLLSQPELRADLGNAGRRWVERNWSWQRANVGLQEILQL